MRRERTEYFSEVKKYIPVVRVFKVETDVNVCRLGSGVEIGSHTRRQPSILGFFSSYFKIFTRILVDPPPGGSTTPDLVFRNRNRSV